MFLKTTVIAASTLALCSAANADIVHSGFIYDEVSDADGGGSATVEIAGLNFEFGILVGGPLDYSYVTTTSEGAGIFVPLTETYEARNFSAGDNIGTLTSVLNMYPLGGGSENVNLVMHDYSGTGAVAGEFSATGTGYVAFGFGSGINFNYGWMEFTSFEEEFEGGLQSYVALTGWAYNNQVNQSIAAGQTAVPGPAAAAAAIGLLGIRRNRRRG